MTRLYALLSSALLLQPAAPPVERSLTVTVTDEKDAPLEGLQLTEVAVLENGVARLVTELEPDARPLTVVVLVDSSEPMSTFYRSHMVEPVAQFLARLPEGSRFAVWVTGDRPRKVADFGSDAAEASRALRRVYPEGGNTLLDALVESSRDLKGEEGRRSVVVVVTGLGVGFANYDRQRVVDEVLKAGATVLAVHFDEGRTAIDPPDRSTDELGAFDYEYVLDRLAKDSGGRRESVLSPMAVGSALGKLSGALRAQYRLRYEPLPEGKDGRPSKLEVTVARPGARARVVPGAR